MKVQFLELTPEARRPGMLRPDIPAVRFEVEGGGVRVALAGQVSPFKDLRFCNLAVQVDFPLSSTFVLIENLYFLSNSIFCFSGNFSVRSMPKFSAI